MPIRVANRIVTTVALVKPIRAARSPINLFGSVLILRMMRPPLHRTAIATGRAIHFNRHAAVSPAAITLQNRTVQNRSERPLFSTSAAIVEIRKPSDITTPLAQARLARP